MKVIKFGGTSVASAKNITIVKDVLKDKIGKEPTIMVVSALGGITNLLGECACLAADGDKSYNKALLTIEQKHLETIKELISIKNQGNALSKTKIILNELDDICRGLFLIGELSDKSRDKVLSFGEILSSTIIYDYFIDQGMVLELANPQVFIKTDNNFGKANVDFSISNKLIRQYFKSETKFWVCPGFVASNQKDVITTLGRGGSDYTAAIIASALAAKALEIWTDVSGMMTADPRLVSSAYTIKNISYDEAMELSHFGAKVIYPPTIQPALEADIPIHIKNTFRKEDEGTVIYHNGNNSEQLIKGISKVENIALLNLTGSGMVGIPNFSHRLFKALAFKKVNVILITQASSEHSICVGINADDIAVAKHGIEEEFEFEIARHKIDPIEIEGDLAIVALVGSRMKEQVGVSGKMFSTLAQNGINIKAIAQGSSEKNISVVIKGSDVKKGLNCLHESFFLSDKKRVNVYVIGVGNVGATLLDQIKEQHTFLGEHHHLDIRIVALANSKKMLFQEEGIEASNWKEEMEMKGEKMSLQGFVDTMFAMNQRNSVFVDNTANEDVANLYEDILKKSIAVVTPNKIACTQQYLKYINLKSTALRYRTKFLFETNVGAGLPVINTLADLVKSGDEVIKVEAVLSGSLNFIFNNFTSDVKFYDIVKQAQAEGYTEPDPRIDLSGVDVMRKILILIRESGYKMELDSIKSQSFMPESCMKTDSVDAFFQELLKQGDHFHNLLKQASEQNKKIKYVATFDKGKAEAGLQLVGQDHPFYNLEGKDNIVLFTTKRYFDQPLIIKGAGAGADVTAMGVFADIIRTAHG